jgi:beta-lactamase regulating signal transducer with metallopeptidase domain
VHLPVQATTRSLAAHAITIPALPGWIDALLVATWTCALLVGVVRLARSWRFVRAVTRNAEPLESSIASQMRHFGPLRGSRRAPIAVSDAIDGACAAGYLRPRVLVARTLVERLDIDDLEAVVLHEEAHLERFDDWTRLAQRVLLAIAGFHPAVRWISRQIDIECEAACDRLVVERIVAPVRYVRAIARVGEISSNGGRGIPPLAPAVLMPRGGLHARVVRLIGQTTAVSRGQAIAASCAAAAVLTSVAVFAVAMPPMVVTSPIDLSLAQVVPAPLPLMWDATQTSSSARRVDYDEAAAAAPSAGAVPPSAGTPATAVADENQPGRHLASVPAHVADEPTPARNEPAPAVAADVVPLSSTALPQIAAPGSTGAIPSGTVAADGTPGWSAVGSSAGQAAVSAGGAASRAGTVIGRAFKRSGLAIARSF